MLTTDLVNLYNRNIFKISLYIYIFQDEKCRLMQSIYIYGLSHSLQRRCFVNICLSILGVIQRSRTYNFILETVI